MPDRPTRQSIRLKHYDYSENGAYFVTVCTEGRRRLFGSIHGDEVVLNDIGNIVRTEWQRTERVRPNTMVDEFIIMPDHFHALLWIKHTVGATRRVARQSAQPRAGHRPAPTAQLVSGSLGAIVGQFKSITTKRINTFLNTPANRSGNADITNTSSAMNGIFLSSGNTSVTMPARRRPINHFVIPGNP